MSLRSKVVLILLCMFLLYGAVDLIIYRFLIFPSFLTLEQDEARKDSDRCIHAINREIDYLDSLCHDWSAWDDTYNFIQTVSSKYIDANLPESSFTDNRLNLIYFFDTRGNIIWGKTYDLKNNNFISLPEFSKESLPVSHPLLSCPLEDTSLVNAKVSGIFHTAKGPMLISSRPVLTSTNTGPVRGSIIMGKFLNDELKKSFIEQTQVDFQIFPIIPGKIPEYIKNIPGQISAEFPFLIQIDKDGHMLIFRTIPDISEKPALLIMTKIPRKITEQGKTTITYGLISIVVIGLTIILIISYLSQKIILQPITNLTDHVLQIGKTDNLSARLNIKQKDETGLLAREFDKMLEKLFNARKELVEQYYFAGMAEMASGVLHNIRNSLNPVIGEIQLIRHDLNNIPAKEMQMVQKELNEGLISNERKENLIQFTMLANESLSHLLTDIKKRLNNVLKSTAQIESILSDHQNLAHSERPVENLELSDLINDSLKLMKNRLKEIISIDIDKSICNTGPVKLHRIALLQIFSNLLINAAESIERQGNIPGKVSIHAEIDKENEAIHVYICDNGQGIEPEILPRIFEYRFTTKKDHSSGIGLHWCANSMTAMKCRIHVKSEGKGKGACFHLILPQKNTSD